MRIVALLLLGLAMTACANGGPREGLELWTMQLKPTFTTYMEDVLAEFREQHPDVPVTWVDVPAAGLENKLLTAIAGGRPPDVVNLNPSFASKLAAIDALADLTDRVEPIKDRFFPTVWEACQINGRTFAIPWYLSTGVTMANAAMLTEAGLPPVPPRTFDEAAEAGRTVKAALNKPFFMPNFGDSGKFMETLVQMGVPLIQDGQPAFNGPEGVAALQYWVDLYKAGIMPRESLTEKHREAIDRFQAGGIAVLTTGPQFLVQVKENAPQLYPEITVGPQLTSENGPIGVSVMNLVIPAASTQQEAAMALASFISNDANQLALAKLAPVLPSTVAAAKDPYFTASGTDAIAQARRISAAQLPRATVLVPPMPKQPELAKALDTALQKACLGQASAQDALDEAATTWRSLLNG